MAVADGPSLHAYPLTTSNNCPVKVFNVYGYTLAAMTPSAAGCGGRQASGYGREDRRACFTEVFYDTLHLLDGDEHCITCWYNETICR